MRVVIAHLAGAVHTHSSGLFARTATTISTTMWMRNMAVIDPEEDYENPVGEVLDDETVNDLKVSRLEIREGKPWLI